MNIYILIVDLLSKRNYIRKYDLVLFYVVGVGLFCGKDKDTTSKKKKLNIL